jgi:hypothetical protein
MEFTFQGRSSIKWRSGKLKASKYHLNDRRCRKIRKLVYGDRRRTIHQLADTVGVRYWVCQEIITGKLNRVKKHSTYWCATHSRIDSLVPDEWNVSICRCCIALVHLFAVLCASVPDCRPLLGTKPLPTCSACSPRFTADPVTMVTCWSYIRKD